MRLSWVITVCDEIDEFQTLLGQVCKEVAKDDEIVIFQDDSKGQEFVAKVEEIVEHFRESFYNISHCRGTFAGDFAVWRNSADRLCTGDFIIQLDADEQIQSRLREFLKLSTSKNPSLQLIAFPRENRVTGITSEDIKEFKWYEKPEGINWPDYQLRFYKNCPEIRWKGKVHEKPTGFGRCYLAPPEARLVHIKTIEKQKRQRELYAELKSN